MTISLAYLGPSGTYTETAAMAYVEWLKKETSQELLLCPYPTIAQTMRSVVEGETKLAVVPVENSIQGSVAMTLDSIWQLDRLQIQQALVLPISHALLSKSSSVSELKKVYSHPQALGQCQGWLERSLPSVELIATNSTTEALEHVKEEITVAAIASLRASELYNIPAIACNINDYPDNCTRFWVLGLTPTSKGNYISLAFSVPANTPGSLVKPLQALAARNINLSRIESRPTKRTLGDYLFYLDLEANSNSDSVKAALAELSQFTAILKIFGNYDVLPISLS